MLENNNYNTNTIFFSNLIFHFAGLVKRIFQQEDKPNSQEGQKKKLVAKKYDGPRQKASDGKSLKYMIFFFLI